VTGSSGLIGSEAVRHFDARGMVVHGIDNNMRADFFGPEGDTSSNLRLLRECTQQFVHHALDIRDRAAMLKLVREVRPDLVVHAAAQPSHDLAASRPFDDFDINAVGTLNLLEATRQGAPEAVFVQMSTNKVYGDAPNEYPLVELETRWEYALPEHFDGVDENCRLDQSLHSVFGASKVAADVMAQEYGRYFGLRVGVFRGGCLTGPQHAGAQLHGFLNYLVKVAAEGKPYRIFGYQGKQVRDQIHCDDVILAIEAFFEKPRAGEVYNIGGERDNSASVLECIDMIDQLSGRKLAVSYVDQARKGDHICYVSNMAKFRSHFPDWSPQWSLDAICEQIWGRHARQPA
jgi:CDP-paratose 2-epimerase